MGKPRNHLQTIVPKGEGEIIWIPFTEDKYSRWTPMEKNKIRTAHGPSSLGMVGSPGELSEELVK